MIGDSRINPLAAVYAERKRCKGIGSTSATKEASRYLLSADVDPTLDSAFSPRELASSGLMLKGPLNYKPDISHATKSGHFNLLRTAGEIQKIKRDQQPRTQTKRAIEERVRLSFIRGG
jgi:hypothetical protein